MKVTSHLIGSHLVFSFIPNHQDIDSLKGPPLARHACTVRLPNKWKRTALHGDLYGLAVSLLALPYTFQELTLDQPVSSFFAQAFHDVTRKTISPVDTSLQPRNVPCSGIPGLAFSGGVDSSAAMSLLPHNAALVFLERCAPDNAQWSSMYDKSAPLGICRHYQGIGRNVTVVSTDLEYLRHPTGFPVDLANGVPAILLAESLLLDSLAYGMILESAYRAGHEFYQDYAQRHHYRLWSRLFSAAGLPLNLVTAGVSEVGTSSIVMQELDDQHVQSCMRGKPGRPCFNCWKCFRKTLLSYALRDTPLPDALLDKAFTIREAMHYLTANPIKHQNVIEYVCSHYSGNHALMALLKKKVCWHGNVDYLAKWYPRSLPLIAERYRDFVQNRISAHIGIMNADDMKQLENWDLRPILSDSVHTDHADKLRIALLESQKAVKC